MDMFAGKTLIRADGSEHPAEEVLCDVKVVALYFSAHWCPPCRHFTPILADAYAEAKEALPCGAEVVFVSLDNSEEDMVKYMDECHGNWYAIKYEDPWREELARKYVTGIPTLIVFKMDGTVISSCGREEVQDQGPEAFRQWADKA
uniref:16 kDa thioredoxion n=1 Tax=Rhipicephalus zambeziensis TaxID=60191 RepID=A0A224YLK0_9ACAR